MHADLYPQGVEPEGRRPARSRCRYADALIALALAAAAAAAAWYGSRAIEGDPPTFVRLNVWFEADCPRVVNDMSVRRSPQERTATHPLHTLLLYPWVVGLRRSTGLEPLVCVRLVRVAIAGACTILFYMLARLISARRSDAVLFTVLAGSSAAAMAWFIVPETWPPGLLSILAALCIVGVGERRPLGPGWDVLASLATLAFTVTNGIVGAAATFTRHPPRRAVLLIAVSVCLLLGLMAVQQQVFPAAAPVPIPRHEVEYMLTSESGGPVRVATVFFCHALVMPAVQAVPRCGPDCPPILSVQHAAIGSSGLLGWAATALWLALLAGGLWGLITAHGARKLRVVLAVAIGSQLVLHLLYGPETFLYASHYGPLLVLASVWSVRTRFRKAARLIALLVVATGGINNLHQLQRAIALANPATPPPTPSASEPTTWGLPNWRRARSEPATRVARRPRTGVQGSDGAPSNRESSHSRLCPSAGWREYVLESVRPIATHTNLRFAPRGNTPQRLDQRRPDRLLATSVRPALQHAGNTSRHPRVRLASKRVRPDRRQFVGHDPQRVDWASLGATSELRVEFAPQQKTRRCRPARQPLDVRRLPLAAHSLITREQHDDDIGPAAALLKAAQRRLRAT